MSTTIVGVSEPSVGSFQFAATGPIDAASKYTFSESGVGDAITITPSPSTELFVASAHRFTGAHYSSTGFLTFSNFNETALLDFTVDVTLPAFNKNSLVVVMCGIGGGNHYQFPQGEAPTFEIEHPDGFQGIYQAGGSYYEVTAPGWFPIHGAMAYKIPPSSTTPVVETWRFRQTAGPVVTIPSTLRGDVNGFSWRALNEDGGDNEDVEIGKNPSNYHERRSNFYSIAYVSDVRSNLELGGPIRVARADMGYTPFNSNSLVTTRTSTTGNFPSLIVDARQRKHCIYQEGASGSEAIKRKFSDDDGVTWSEADTLFSSGKYPVAVYDPSSGSILVVAYLAGNLTARIQEQGDTDFGTAFTIVDDVGVALACTASPAPFDLDYDSSNSKRLHLVIRQTGGLIWHWESYDDGASFTRKRQLFVASLYPTVSCDRTSGQIVFSANTGSNSLRARIWEPGELEPGDVFIVDGTSGDLSVPESTHDLSFSADNSKRLMLVTGLGALSHRYSSDDGTSFSEIT